LRVLWYIVIMKDISEYVIPVKNYTDKIHTGIRMMFRMYPWLSFTRPQMMIHLQREYKWMKNLDERQTQVVEKIVTTGIKKMIQVGEVKKVTSKVSVESQWQWAKSVVDSGYTDITSSDSVAKTEEAKKAIRGRAIGGKTLFRLNHEKINA
jgi:hypothetical protein